MSYVVKLMSWAGWIWAGVFFVLVLGQLQRQARRDRIQQDEPPGPPAVGGASNVNG